MKVQQTALDPSDQDDQRRESGFDEATGDLKVMPNERLITIIKTAAPATGCAALRGYGQPVC